MTRYIEHTKPNSRFKDPCVYVLVDHDGKVINVYNEYTDAVARAIEEVTEDSNHTYIDNFEFTIYVQGDKGEVCIFVEELL